MRLISGLLLLVVTGCAACHTCPDCDCEPQAGSLKVKPEKEERSCWNVECEDVCIPQVGCPCDDCCQARCGRVRRVAVLKKETYEVDGCKYEWKIHGTCPACGEVHQPAADGPYPVPPSPADPPAAGT